MRRRVGTHEAKTHLSDYLNRVAYGGERVVVERHGKPVAALVGNQTGLAVDQGSVTAQVAGVYQIEVYAYSDTMYRLEVTGGRSGVAVAGAVRPNADKTARTSPVVGVDNEPEGTTAVPAAPVAARAARPATGPTCRSCSTLWGPVGKPTNPRPSRRAGFAGQLCGCFGRTP